MKKILLFIVLNLEKSYFPFSYVFNLQLHFCSDTFIIFCQIFLEMKISLKIIFVTKFVWYFNEISLIIERDFSTVVTFHVTTLSSFVCDHELIENLGSEDGNN